MSISNLSDSEKRVKIAEACGWKLKPTTEMQMCFPGGNQERVVDRWFITDGTFEIGQKDLPDYLNDLNAMHEAEKVLPFKVRNGLYKSHLLDITFADPNAREGMFFATARQRADAFLLTLDQPEGESK